MKVPFGTRLWIAWQVMRGKFTESTWDSRSGAVTLTFVERAIANRLWGL